jgi:polyhydroxybutyrate depolymerase
MGTQAIESSAPRPFVASLLSLAFSLAGAACSSSGSHQPQGGSGGAATGSGGAAMGAASGGATGTTGSGGDASSGGATATGGRGSGGASSGGSGGAAGSASASGGAAGGPASGGASAGGHGASGGVTGSGGSPAGGATGSGGAASGGGSSGMPALPSAGCNSTTTQASGRFNITVSGASREYILKLPDTYDASHPYKLMFGWHGHMYDDNWVADGGPPLTGPFFGVEDMANDSTIFVAPQAAGSGWANSDLAVADAMVAKFEADLCIDKNRIFSAGFSAGAMLTVTLGCERGDVFRGIAVMSGSTQLGCTAGTHSVAYWGSHGDSDPTVPIASGEAVRDEFAKRNHCGTQTMAVDPMGCTTFLGCDAGYPVTFCIFSGVHEPPPFAGQGIWGFISQF